MGKASDEGCDRAVRSHNEGLPAGDTGYADKFKMVAGEWRGHIVEKEDEMKGSIIKTTDSALTRTEDLAAAEMSL